MGIDLDKWIEKVRKTEYLAEDELKALCDYVSHLISTHITAPEVVIHVLQWENERFSLADQGNSCRRVKCAARQ